MQIPLTIRYVASAVILPLSQIKVPSKYLNQPPVECVSAFRVRVDLGPHAVLFMTRFRQNTHDLRGSVV